MIEISDTFFYEILMHLLKTFSFKITIEKGGKLNGHVQTHLMKGITCLCWTAGFTAPSCTPFLGKEPPLSLSANKHHCWSQFHSLLV